MASQLATSKLEVFFQGCNKSTGATVTNGLLPSDLLGISWATYSLSPTRSTPPRWTHLESAPRTKLLRKHRQTSCPKTRYIYPLIYHKNEPFLWVNLPVPWILWKIMNEIFHQRNQSRDKAWDPCRMAYEKKHNKEELIIPLSKIIQQLSNYFVLALSNPSSDPF